MANTLKFGNGQWATGNGTALAYNDENANFKPLPFDFTRASSGTTVNQSGLIETVGSGIPRIDFQGNTKGALLLEPSRTNEVTNSVDLLEYFNNTATVTDTANSTTSPNGNKTAYKYQGNGTFTSVRLFENRSFTENTDYCLSVFAKAGTNNFLQLGILGVSGGRTVYFDLSSVSASSEFGKIENYGNGWFRCSMIASVTSGDLAGNANIYITKSVSVTSFDSNLEAQNATMFLWGAQLEAGSYATSYIPTSGSAVTRVRDLSDTQNLSHVIGQTEGVIFYDAILVHKSTSTSEDLFELSIDDGSANNAFFINNYNNTLTVLLKSGGSTSFSNNSFNPTEGARYKLGFAYKQNDFALYINGNQIATDSSGTVPSMNQITFGNYYDNRVNFQSNVKVNDFKLYNTRLTNSELAALTQV